MTTVCTKLFHIVDPDVAVFGSKDFQQVQVIRKMVRDLCMNLTIEAVETVRESDGLARSSRNAYLTEERGAWLRFSTAYFTKPARPSGMERHLERIDISRISQIEAAGGRIDYLEIVDPETLRLPTPYSPIPTCRWPHFSGVLD